MAGENEAAFELLGVIGVDRDALRRSLNEAEGDVRASAARLKRTWSQPDLFAPPDKGQLGLSPADDMSSTKRASSQVVDSLGEDHKRLQGHVHTSGQRFSHLARIIREVLAGPLVGLSPEFAKLASAGATAARSARYLGASLGAVLVGTVLVSEAVGEYIKVARESTMATFESQEAVATLDVGRATAGYKKLADEIAEYNLRVDQATGKVESGFWQKILAWSGIAANAVTGHIDETIKKFQEFAHARLKIEKDFEMPKAMVESRKAAAELLGREASLAATNAHSLADLRASYDETTRSIRLKSAADRDALDLEEKRSSAEIKHAATVIKKRGMEDATSARDEALKMSQSRLDLAMTSMARTAALKIASDANKKYGEDVAKVNRDVAVVDEILTAEHEKFSLKRAGMNEAETFELKKTSDEQEKSLAQRAAAEETFVQKELTRNQKRVESSAAAAESIARSENEIRQRRLQSEGSVDSRIDLETRLADTRRRSIEPLEAEVRTSEALYESRRRALELEIAANVDVIAKHRELGELDREYADQAIGLAEKRAQVVARLASEEDRARGDRERAEVAQEDRRLQHAVAMGRVTLAQEVDAARAAARDPRRDQVDQFRAEEDAQRKLTEATEAYFSYRRAWGQSTLGEELKFYEGLAAQQVAGSKSWYDALDKVAGVNEKIRGQMQSVADITISIGVQELKSHGRKMASLQDIVRAEQKARSDDAKIIGRAASGRRVDIDRYMQARGRQSQYEQIDRAGTNLGDAVRGAATTPGEAMARSLARIGDAGQSAAALAAGAGEATQSMTGLSVGADTLTKALDAAAAAALAFADSAAAGNDDSKLGRSLFLADKRGLASQGAHQ